MRSATRPTVRSSRRAAPGVVAVVASLGLVLGACGDTDEDPATTDAVGTTAPVQGADDTDTTTAPTDDQRDDADKTTEDDMDAGPTRIPVPGQALPTGPVPDAIVNRTDVQDAIAAEADRRGVEPDEVEVVGHAEVTWPDGSLGCPKPGMMYTQALVPGRQLILAVDGQQASYHASSQGSFRYCASPMAPAVQGPTPTDM